MITQLLSLSAVACQLRHVPPAVRFVCLQNSEPSPFCFAYACAPSAAASFCWDWDGPNTGVIVVRNAPLAFEMLEEWALARREGGLCEAKNELTQREQASKPTAVP